MCESRGAAQVRGRSGRFPAVSAAAPLAGRQPPSVRHAVAHGSGSAPAPCRPARPVLPSECVYCRCVNQTWVSCERAGHRSRVGQGVGGRPAPAPSEQPPSPLLPWSVTPKASKRAPLGFSRGFRQRRWVNSPEKPGAGSGPEQSRAHGLKASHTQVHLPSERHGLGSWEASGALCSVGVRGVLAARVC